MSEILYETADNAEGQLSAGINGSVTSIALKAGEGAEFPQPYTGTTSSQGDATTLNDTGALGNLTVGQFIRNVTDGSWAFVTVLTSVDSVKTTRLQGGTANIWDNAEEWQVGEFVITLEKRDADGDVTQREKCLVKDRSTDTLTIRTRGYDGSSGQTFATDDYVNLHVTSITIEEFIDTFYSLTKMVDDNQTNEEARLDALEDGSYPYVVTTGSANAYVAATPAFSAYAAGNMLRFKANFQNTGSATINVNGLGAKTMKKKDGATNLKSGDIANGQIVEITYDGTNFQMTGRGNEAFLSATEIGLFGDGSDGSVTWSSSTNLDPTNEFEYTDATLDVSQTLSVSSVNSVLVIKTSGDVTINGDIDLDGKGAAGGAGGAGGAGQAAGTIGTAGNSLISGWTSTPGSPGLGDGANGGPGGGGGGNSVADGSVGIAGGGVGTPGAGGTKADANQMAFLANIMRGVTCGAGGGGGGGGIDTSPEATGGSGGAGGGALIWFVGGDLTFGASSNITCNGVAGGAGLGDTTDAGGGGGGGGAGVVIFVVGGSITDGGVTLTATAGAGGNGPGSNAGEGGAGATGKIFVYSLADGTIVTV